MPRGGPRLGAGRPKGVRNKRTLAREQIRRLAEEGGITPLECMLATMRDLLDQGDLNSRLLACEIAKDAAVYIHPKLTSVHGTLSINPLQELFDYVASKEVRAEGEALSYRNLQGGSAPRGCALGPGKITASGRPSNF